MRRRTLFPAIAAVAIAMLSAVVNAQEAQVSVTGRTLPTVTILPFETDRTGAYALPPSAGAAAADLMVHQLVNSGSYRVLDKSWLTNADDVATHRARLDDMRRAAAEAGVDYLVLGSFIRYSEERRNRAYGGAVFKVPVIGGLHKRGTESVIGLAIRVVDVRTGEVVATTTTYGRASRKKLGLGLLGVISGGGFSSNGSAAGNLLAGEAIEHAVADAGKALTIAAARLTRSRGPA